MKELDAGPDWVRQLRHPERAPAVDAQAGSEHYVAVVDPYWCSLKNDLKDAVREFQTRHRVSIEDVGHRILLRGDCYGVDVTLKVEKQTIYVRYSQRFERRPIRPTHINLTLDMRSDFLVLLDPAGCCIEHPAQFILERFFNALIRPHRRW
jgi:hypothetical protein